MGVAALAATLLVGASPSTGWSGGSSSSRSSCWSATSRFTSSSALRPTSCGRRRRRSCARFERLALAAALINLLVIVADQPAARGPRAATRFPSILQDAIVIGVLLLVATFVFKEQLLTTSAVGAVVVGFALQDTLGNAFAGLAHPERAAVQGRPLDSRRRVRRTRRRNHLARDQAAHQDRQLRRRPEQHHRQGSDHQLLRAGGADPARARGRRELPDARPPSVKEAMSEAMAQVAAAC